MQLAVQTGSSKHAGSVAVVYTVSRRALDCREQEEVLEYNVRAIIISHVDNLNTFLNFLKLH